MAEAAVAVPVAESKGPGLFARLIGVIFSPRATYQAIVARPRALGAFVVTIAIMAVTEGAFFRTTVMQEVLMDQQVKMIESFGVNINDETYARMEQGVARAAYTTPLTLAIGIPIVAAIFAGIILGIWGMLMGGAGTFKQVYAILAHSGVIMALNVWWCINVAMGVGVLFKRKTGGIAATFLAVYVLIALLQAIIRAGN